MGAYGRCATVDHRLSTEDSFALPGDIWQSLETFWGITVVQACGRGTHCPKQSTTKIYQNFNGVELEKTFRRPARILNYKRRPDNCNGSDLNDRWILSLLTNRGKGRGRGNKK